MKYKVIWPVALLFATQLCAQPDSSREKIYNVQVKYELPAATAGLILFSTVALPAVIRHASITEADLEKLHPSDVNWFDRPEALRRTTNYSKAVSSSDVLLNSTLIAPVFLMLDKRIRKDWLNTITLYMLTHAVNNTIFLGGTSFVRRVRPLVYNTELPLSERTGKGKTNSFYSGHVSNVAASTFFIVKLYTDHHHIKGWKRIALYGAAAVPPGCASPVPYASSATWPCLVLRCTESCSKNYGVVASSVQTDIFKIFGVSQKLFRPFNRIVFEFEMYCAMGGIALR